MNNDSDSLGRRWAACPGFRWMPGMLRRFRGVPCRVTEDDLLSGIAYSAESVPDLSDPATLGCLLALVREASRCPEAHVYYATLTRLWVVRWGHEGRGERTVDGHTEAEALVLALEVLGGEE
jgi:hypothetical protein